MPLSIARFMQANNPSESDQCRPGVVHLKFHVGGEIGKRSIDAIGSQDEVDNFVGGPCAIPKGIW